MLYLVETSQDMGHIHDRIPILVYLVKHVVAEEFDDVSIACF